MEDRMILSYLLILLTPGAHAMFCCRDTLREIDTQNCLGERGERERDRERHSLSAPGPM